MKTVVAKGDSQEDVLQGQGVTMQRQAGNTPRYREFIFPHKLHELMTFAVASSTNADVQGQIATISTITTGGDSSAGISRGGGVSNIVAFCGGICVVGCAAALMLY